MSVEARSSFARPTVDPASTNTIGTPHPHRSKRGVASHRVSSAARNAAPHSPYARFGLFRNPFGELTRAERCDLALIDRAACLSMLRCPKAALQVLGPCGHGKTTHLLALQQAIKRADGASDRCQLTRLEPVACNTLTQYLDNYVYFPEDGTQPILPTVRPLFVDEAQRLSWRRRRQLLVGKGPLILGTHVDLSRPLGKAGFTVHTLDVSRPHSSGRLQQIFNRRILASRTSTPTSLSTGPIGFDDQQSKSNSQAYHPLCLTLPQVEALQRQFGSDIRRMGYYLYDAFQRFAEKGGSWLPVN